jgi:hypothetical protein
LCLSESVMQLETGHTLSSMRTPSTHHTQTAAAALITVCLYVFAYAQWFLNTPLGRFPLLDSAENLQLAGQIADGTLPRVPFFRAMLYPALLSGYIQLGVSSDWLPVAAGLTGCVFHLCSTVCVYRIARRAWASARSGIWAGVLFGFNPVAIYFAAEPLDTTFGLFLFLVGLDLMHSGLTLAGQTRSQFPACSSEALTRVAGAAAFWSLAMLSRPHYAVVVVVFPVLLLGSFWRTPRVWLKSAAVFGVVTTSVLAFAGLAQHRLTGQFRILPTQGGYSLWVGNRPGANGRYYEQQIHLAAGTAAESENPARIESEVLYRKQTGESGPIEPERINQYWRAQTVRAIRAEPIRWLQLMLRKAYFLCNDFEQYNNKTYAVQKSLCPVLRFNPLGWGVTLVIFAAGLPLLFRIQHRTRGGFLLLSVGALYAAGVILFFVSDRFRLPLLPFLCIGAAGWGVYLRNSCRIRQIPVCSVAATAAVAGCIGFSNLWGVRDLAPAVQDYIALSIACGKAGDDLGGLRWARKALECRPDHPDALARATSSFFNCRLQGIDPAQVSPTETWDFQLTRVAQIPQPAASTKLIQAVALWKTGRLTQARNLLQELKSRNYVSPGHQNDATIADDALGVLLLAGLGDAEDRVLARNRAQTTASFYLLSALARAEDTFQLVPISRRRLVADLEPNVGQIFPKP